MKRLWLYTGVAGGSVVQFFVEQIWNSYIRPDAFYNFRPILRDFPLLPSTFLSQLAFALVIGFLYLHVPDKKRSVKSGITIGTILGLLSGLSQYLNWYALFNIPFSLAAAELIKMAVLGIAGGVVISFAELRMNPRNPPSVA